MITHTSDHEVAAALRLELKLWENEWAAANGGKKPGREVVKNNASIAAKYKEYNRISQRHAKPVETPRKRKAVLHERSTNPIASTPQRAEKNTLSSTIIVERTHEEDERNIEPTPAFIRCALGPTPQRDGQVLGIFDLFPSVASPSKPDATPRSTAATPSKASAPPSSDIALSRTPQSSGKRFYLDAFAGTPLKRKRDCDGDGGTPTSAKRAFATPSFLRRRFPLAPITEEEDRVELATGTGPLFKRKGGFVRTLSSMIQNLRRNEEQRMDDEWEIMQELEAEDDRKGNAELNEHANRTSASVHVVDSQAEGVMAEGDMPLGPDTAVHDAESDDGARDRSALDANGNPRKVWKKKGLKRQTRRVIMRPVLHAAQKAEDATAGRGAHDDDDDDDETQAVAETQLRSPPRWTKTHHNDDDDDDEGARSSSDFVADDEDDDDDERATRREPSRKRIDDAKDTQKQKQKQKQKQQPKDPKQKEPTSEQPPGKKKKVNELAHANFRKLKIKNKNSKANARGGGRRFGGRR